MGRVKEELFDAEWDTELAAWEASPEGRAERERLEREAADAAAKQLRQEKVWSVRYPAEWDEWQRLQPLLSPVIEFAASNAFDFDDFLKEVGRRPSHNHTVQRPDEALPYTQGNLRWAEWGRTGTDQRPAASPYLTVDEAAAYCRRTRKTLLNHHSLGSVRSMPGTRPPLFRKEDLDDWLTARRRPYRK
ncbi:MAG TPA: helix-turn-helix domain-containing protein [Urbifossiella sp.]|nr:helix-turn-helix domain-containing protein [Urbifossiella sp.]